MDRTVDRDALGHPGGGKELSNANAETRGQYGLRVPFSSVAIRDPIVVEQQWRVHGLYALTVVKRGAT